ncbi:MAG: hypothetical protein V3T86_06990 [Planctomycetota bacterium]
MRRRRYLLWAMSLLICVVTGAQADETKPDFEVTDDDQVYYGSGDTPDAPAICRADDVWAKIPEYKKIVDDDLDEDDAEYHLLMKKATERFESALEDLAKREEYDLIAEEGAIKANNGKKIPDGTDDLVDLVSRSGE